MIKYLHGNILDADAKALVNPVNCVGVMGKGLALQFKRTFPENYLWYKRACGRNRVQIGQVLSIPVSTTQFVINFPTKRHFQDQSKLKDIKVGLEALVSAIELLGIQSIAIPALGCGLGGLRWPLVRKLIEEEFVGSSVRVMIYEPLDKFVNL